MFSIEVINYTLAEKYRGGIVMIMKKIRGGISLVLGCALILIGNCKSATEPQHKAVEFTYPAGGETLYLDSTINIRWKTDTSLLGPSPCSVLIWLSTDGGKTWGDGWSYAVTYPNAIPPDTEIYSWKIDTLNPRSTPPLPSDSCKLMIKDYSTCGSTTWDTSDMFKIHK